MRMRTIEQAYNWVHEQDSQSNLTKHAIRHLVITHQIPSVSVGKKYLLSLESLEVFLLSGNSTPTSPETAIRKIPEKFSIGGV